MTYHKVIFADSNTPGLDILQQACQDTVQFVVVDDTTDVHGLSQGKTHVAFLWQNGGAQEIPFEGFETVLRDNLIVDLITCNLGLFDFPERMHALEANHTNLQIRYSLDRTANPEQGGDWIMESHEVSVKEEYFSDHLQTYPYSLELGDHSSCIVHGDLYTWGWNANGQLGDSTNTDRLVPTLVQYFNTHNITVTQVSLGEKHSAAIDANGNLYTWGYNGYGQLGDSTNTDRLVPTLVPYFDTNSIDITQVSLGLYHSAAIDASENLYTWGYNGYGQLGDSTNTDRLVPTLVPYFDTNSIDITQVSLGLKHSSAIDTNGKLYTWGFGPYGQLGHAEYFPGITPWTTSSSPVPNKLLPTQVSDLSNVVIKQVSLGRYHSAALDTNGKLYTWGVNTTGSLGHDVTFAGLGWTDVPTLVSDLSNVVIKQVSLGKKHSAAIDANGNLYTWGYNGYGQLGHGNNTNLSVPTLVSDLSNVVIVQVTLEHQHSAAVDANGKLYTWGDNTLGRLGRSTPNSGDSWVPGVVQLPDDDGMPYLPLYKATYTYTSGDPHIFPLFGQSYELPNVVCAYRMLQGKDLVCNMSVRAITNEEQNEIKRYYEQETGKPVPDSLTTSGVFYEKLFLQCEGHTFTYDYDKCKGYHDKYFRSSTSQSASNQIGEKCSNKDVVKVTFTHSIHGKMTFNLCHFSNPQLKYGLGCSLKNSIGLSGLLIKESSCKHMQCKLTSTHTMTIKKGTNEKNSMLQDFCKALA